MKHKMVLALLLTVLQLTCQACFVPGLGDIPGIADSPSTQAPGAGVTPQPPKPPSAPQPPQPTQPPQPINPPVVEPQTLTGEGVRNDFASDGAICLVYQPVTLVVKGDGTAALTTTGASIIDHINCTAGTSEVTWYIDGMVDASGQRVTFQTCNFGRFTAAGEISFAGGALNGEVSCTNPDGFKWITLLVGQF